MRTLEVWLGDQLVGHIKENRKGGRFAYTPEIVEKYSGAPLLSLALPVKRKPYGESKTENWFSGLLPEGTRRQDICRSLGLSQYDWIGLLAEIGWECAGAIRIFEEGKAVEHPGSYESVSKENLTDQLADISARMPSNSTESFRMSLGGFQEKMCLAMPRLGDAFISDGEGALLPIGDAASTHILKPENVRAYPGSAESEAWAMIVASYAARCSRVALLRLNGAPDTVVVERYDRAGVDWPKNISRIHQEDACQALGLAPRSKYATEREPKGDDPTYKAIAELLKKYAPNPHEEMQELLRQITVNMAIGNWDAHAKNVSFLFESPMAPTVAPMYDVLPIAEVEKRTTLLSLRINGSLDPLSVTKSSLIEEASSWGLECEVSEQVIVECLGKLEAGLHKAAEQFPEASKRHEFGVRERLARLS